MLFRSLRQHAVDDQHVMAAVAGERDAVVAVVCLVDGVAALFQSLLQKKPGFDVVFNNQDPHGSPVAVGNVAATLARIGLNQAQLPISHIAVCRHSPSNPVTALDCRGSLVAEQRRDATHRDAPIETLGLSRVDLQELLAVALGDEVLGRHAELLGEDLGD